MTPKHLAVVGLNSDLPIPQPSDPLSVLELAAQKARAGVSVVLATVLQRQGSAPATPGQKLLLSADGTCAGTVGGGALEREVLRDLERMLTGGLPEHDLRTFKLGAELGMCCGGQAEVVLEAIAPFTPCLLVGGGHVARATAPLLSQVGFAVTVVDAREEWGGANLGPNIRSLAGEYDEVGRDIPLRGVVVVMTHDHALDQAAIEWALKKGFAYVGGIGSRAKAQRTRTRLEAKGFPARDCDRVRMPIGVDIGARLPEEIAVAIAAELVAWRRTSAPGGTKGDRGL